jgi:hypothetical protein
MKDGSLHASAAPASALRTPSVAKLLQAACSIKKKPHMKMLRDGQNQYLVVTGGIGDEE